MPHRVRDTRTPASAPLPALQHDRVHVPAIVRLAAMHRAAVAVEALVGIGVDADIVDHQYPGIFQPHPDESGEIEHRVDRKSTRLNSSHANISYAVFCLKKKIKKINRK